MLVCGSVDQEGLCGLCKGCWVRMGSAVLAQLTLSPLLSPAPLTACGGVPGASPPWCACTNRAVTPPTAVATGSAWPGTATATATSGQVLPVTPWTAALPTAACTAPAAPVSACTVTPRGLGAAGGQDLALHPWGISLGNIVCLPARHQLRGWGCFPCPPASETQMARACCLLEAAAGLGWGSGLETSSSVPQFPFLPQGCALGFL